MILNDEIQDEFSKLRESGEWKRFTIAFYGETNAGKSTLIETLRLLFKEPLKVEQQQRFKQLQQQSGLTQEAFDRIRQLILKLEDQVNISKEALAELKKQHLQNSTQADDEVKALENLVSEIKSSQNLWQKLLSLFSKIPEEQELRHAVENLAALSKKQAKELAHTTQQFDGLQKQLMQAEAEHQRLNQEAANLAQFADGQIIGDGRSDFTRDNAFFDFDVGGQQFTLIDVPGIEGQESIVSKPIEEAVRKAHAVFYVTRTPRPPQTHEGDIGDKKGTLEKIKEHLGSQTEVWTIYNHPVTNPRALAKKQLLNEDLQMGLNALDGVLKSQLNDQYCQSIALSARPAYLALTECVVPGQKDANEKRKFIEGVGDIQSILELSQVNAFVDKLKLNIVGDYKAKIKKSNLNKAYKVVENALEQLTLLISQFNASTKAIKRETEHAQSQIDVAMEQFNGNMRASGGKILRQFKMNVEEKVYNRIDSDISNDEFKSVLKRSMESEAAALEKNIQEVLKNTANTFQEDVSRIIKRSNQHLQDIVSMQDSQFTLKNFDFSIKVDNGLKTLGIFTSGVSAVIGIVALASNPVGWTVGFIGGAIALVGALVGVAKAAFGFFSSSYKQSQQRKETNKVLDKAASSLESKMDDIFYSMKKEMGKEIDKVKIELVRPLKQYADILTIIKDADSELSNVANKLQQYIR